MLPPSLFIHKRVMTKMLLGIVKLRGELFRALRATISSISDRIVFGLRGSRNLLSLTRINTLSNEQNNKIDNMGWNDKIGKATV